MNRVEASSNGRRWKLRQLVYLVGLVVAVSMVLLVSFTGQYSLAPGDVASQDIYAPRELTFVSEILTVQAQEEARRQVESIYTRPDFSIVREQLDRVRAALDFVTAVRADTYATDSQKRSWVLSVDEIADMALSDVTVMLTLPDVGWSRVQVESRGLVDQILREEEIRGTSLNGVRERVPLMVPLELPQDEASLVVALVQRFIVPNSFYDQEATDLAREQATQAVGPVVRTVRNGEIIVRDGSVVSDLEVEALAQLGLTTPRRDWPGTILTLALALALTLLLGLYLYVLQREALVNRRLEGLMFLLLVTFMWLARLLVPSGPLLLHLYPVAALGILLATTVGREAALGGVLLLAVISGWIAGGNFAVLAMVGASGAAAALTLPKYEQTASIFRAGLLGGLVMAVVGVILSPVRDLTTDPLPFLIEAGASVAGGVVSGGLALGGLFLLAPLFDLTTTFRLVELSHPNHPLLQRLLREAPATFHHTMMVASMAEQAAERIGANALLTRAGTYYHDVGKLMRPYFFVENQEGMSNPHDRLDPQASASIVVGHVADGLKLARQYGLPARVRAFIPEHHGTAQASFFFQKALKAAGGEAGLVDESLFHYPGPRPQSRETSLTMLADGCEAATRAARPTTPEEITAVVERIFDARIRGGQLDECPITLHDLAIVKATYIEVLRGAYHPRIQYPQPTEKGKEAS
ncbi:MAG: HDIG domain-containing protein [Anaerolineae bacterium]|nr:HDIG domain-containing protein [Anaerolineae bacterium]